MNRDVRLGDELTRPRGEVCHAELVVLARRTLERGRARRAISLEQSLAEQQLTARSCPSARA